jgi:Zn-dependent protease
MEDQLSLTQKIVVWVLPVIFAITVHEVAHGWAAKHYGDKTALRLGRLSLNPIKHIDWIGTVILPGVLLLSGTGIIFGWAKPVPVDPRNFKHPRTNMAMVALAGPLSNFLMALAWALCVRLGVVIDIEAISLPLVYSGLAGISINTVLGVLNLIPLPPMDGSRILSGLLPDYWAYQYNRLEPYGFPLLLLLMVSGGLNLLIGYPLSAVHSWFYSLTGL